MRPAQKSISVVVADDHPVVLEGIAGVLGAERDLRILAQCRTGSGALRAIEELKPAIAVLDIAMPEINGVDVLIRLRADGADTKVILLTANATDHQLLSGIEYGAGALLLKDAPISELPDIIRRVAAGERCFPSELVDAALARQTGRETTGERLKSLSPREREVILLVADGLANKEIGQKLNVSEGTVKIHLHNIYQKTGIGNRIALAALVLAHRQS